MNDTQTNANSRVMFRLLVPPENGLGWNVDHHLDQSFLLLYNICIPLTSDDVEGIAGVRNLRFLHELVFIMHTFTVSYPSIEGNLW